MRKESKKERIEQGKLLKERMASVKNKIIVMSGKGSIGKITVAVKLVYNVK